MENFIFCTVGVLHVGLSKIGGGTFTTIYLKKLDPKIQISFQTNCL